MAYDNNKQRQSETKHLDLKGIKDALGGLNENLTMTPEGEDESTPVLPAIASALDSIASALATIAERLNPLYMAEYVEPVPDPDEGGEGGDDTPPVDPSDNNGEGGEGGNDPDPSDNTEPGVS